MRSSHILIAASVVCASLGGDATRPSSSAGAQSERGTHNLAGRTVRCEDVRIVIDNSLPSEGGAMGDHVLLLNPRMLNQQPEIVRLFVFHHECGHTKVGDSELDADCFAVKQGVRDGWLDKSGLTQVCDSFEGVPETATHPSAARRCRNIDQCFATAVAAMPQSKPAPAVTAALPARPPTAGASNAYVAKQAPPSFPRLVSGPTRLASGDSPPASDIAAVGKANPCAQLEGAGLDPRDPIARLIKDDEKRQLGCR
jgi:hypothetical protein